MFTIQELPSKKLPCRTSLFILSSNFNRFIQENFEQMQASHYDKKTMIYEVAVNKLSFLVTLLLAYGDVKFIPYKEPTIKLPQIDTSKFKVKPYQHQKEGIEYGLAKDGWLLLDSQGLGKSLQMIYLAEELKKKEGLQHCLIICGVNGLKYNWASEIAQFSDLSYTILGQTFTKSGKSKIASVKERCKQLKMGIKEFFVITNIETLQSKEFIEAFKDSRSTFDMIVLDEAHKVKNPSSKSAKNLLKLKSKRNIALTGTIIMNTPENAYLPLKWTGNCDSTYTLFKAMYNVYGGFGGVQVIGYKNLDLLQDLLASCSLRRLKEQVLDLPEKTYQIEYVEMGTKQKQLYDEVSRGIAEELDKLPKNKKLTIMQEIVMHMRQRQLTASPSILTTDDVPCAKLDRLEDLIETIVSQGDKVLVFCTFKGTMPELEKRLKQYNPLFCTGDDKDEDISRNRDIFNNDPTRKVMCCTWQKMGTGFTLTAANYLIFIDTPWTYASFEQAADRIHRIGQKKNVSIITLITKDTYDERVQEILDTKETLSDYLVDGKVSEELKILEDYQ